MEPLEVGPQVSRVLVGPYGAYTQDIGSDAAWAWGGLCGVGSESGEAMNMSGRSAEWLLHFSGDSKTINATIVVFIHVSYWHLLALVVPLQIRLPDCIWLMHDWSRS